jgi:hypothetical protein
MRNLVAEGPPGMLERYFDAIERGTVRLVADGE